MVNLKKFFTVLLLFIFPFYSLAFANQRFIDVPSSHWAHDAIINISDSGFMVGNTAGEFRPNAPLDKFETARILAHVAGFRLVNITAEEEAFINNAYISNATLLATMARNYDRWSNIANREIAYLLALGILTEADLNNFIVVENGQEQLRALSRQEAAVFIVRVLGLSQSASRGTYAQLFNDDNTISPQWRHCIYFLRAGGVLSGDENGNFMPNVAVTRASFALMLDRAMLLEESPASTQHQIISGNISIIYPSIRAIQIQSSDSTVIYRIADNSTISINGATASFANLSIGMRISATLENGQIASLVASSLNETPQHQITTISTQTTPLPTQATTQPTFPRLYTNLQGIVYSVTSNTITLQIRFLTPSSITQNENIIFSLANNSQVTMGAQPFSFSNIEEGDIVSIIINGGYVYEINVTERSRRLTGTLVDRVHQPSLNTITYTIRAQNGNYYALLVTNDTILERSGHGQVNWQQIRLGDTIEVVVDGQSIVSLFAFGNSTTVDGIVTALNLRQGISEIEILNNGITITYYITGTLEGLNLLQIGDRVRLRLDSLEVEGITRLQ